MLADSTCRGAARLASIVAWSTKPASCMARITTFLRSGGRSEGGPDEAEGVEPGVAEEAPVFDREHGLHQVVGQVLVAHAPPLLAALIEEVGDELGFERLLRVALLRLPSPDLLHLALVEGHDPPLRGRVRDRAGQEGNPGTLDRELPRPLGHGLVAGDGAAGAPPGPPPRPAGRG